MRGNYITRIGISCMGLVLGMAVSAQTSSQSEVKQKAGKPLAGYTAILVEPFAVEKNQFTTDFPTGEEANLQLSAMSGLRQSGIFDKVLDGTRRSEEGALPAEASTNAGQRIVILSGTVVSFNKGSSGARFMTWPLPVGVSKAKVHFVFRDAASNEEVLRFEKEAKFQAAANAGIATKEGQMAHLKGGLVEALVQETKRNR
ncbi:MAG TPA: hypothetical protein VMI10_06635 [Terriglobales bacterium]|nr:hypothetical protein [Terriglobales bacterium]